MFGIKICGITTPGDARLAAEAGADAIGINFYAGSKRFVDVEIAKKIAGATPPEVAKVGVFVNETAQRVREVMAKVPLDFVQLHGDETVEMISQIDSTRVVKAFRCREANLAPVGDYLTACGFSNAPAAVLVDAYEAGEFGGTGHTLDWASVGRDNSLPEGTRLILAGGLTPENVADAIRLAQPCGVDVASGVESSPGVKDADKVRLFVENARRTLTT